MPNGTIDAQHIVTGSKVPPSTLRTIGDALNEKRISWAYYGGGYDAAVRVANGSVDPVDQLIAANYCDICNAFSYASSIMGDSEQRKAHIKASLMKVVLQSERHPPEGRVRETCGEVALEGQRSVVASGNSEDPKPCRRLAQASVSPSLCSQHSVRRPLVRIAMDSGTPTVR
jgi:hypothetical protein